MTGRGSLERRGVGAGDPPMGHTAPFRGSESANISPISEATLLLSRSYPNCRNQGLQTREILGSVGLRRVRWSRRSM
eukprot:3044431-Alexandrium_andersonii.AAC.1